MKKTKFIHFRITPKRKIVRRNCKKQNNKYYISNRNYQNIIGHYNINKRIFTSTWYHKEIKIHYE